MYGQTITIGRFSVWVPGLPSYTETQWIAKAKQMLITEINGATQ